MDTPTEFEMLGFFAALETHLSLETMLPGPLVALVSQPLLHFLAKFSEKYSIELRLTSLALLAIAFYEEHLDDENSRVKLLLWQDAHEKLSREEHQEELDADFDEELWGSAFNG